MNAIRDYLSMNVAFISESSTSTRERAPIQLEDAGRIVAEGAETKAEPRALRVAV